MKKQFDTLERIAKVNEESKMLVDNWLQFHNAQSTEYILKYLSVVVYSSGSFERDWMCSDNVKRT